MSWTVGDFGRGARNWGIENCRTIAGSGNRSLHGEGRAIDVGFSGSGNPNGTALLQVLLRHRVALGIQLIIWNRRIYSARHPNGAPYSRTGNATIEHRDHLHIELTWHAARTLTLGRVRQIVAGTSSATVTTPVPVTVPIPEPEPEEDDDVKQTLIRHHDGGIWHYQGKARSHCTPADVNRYRFLGVEMQDVSGDRALSEFFLRHSFNTADVGQTALRSAWLQTVVGRIADKFGVAK